MSVQIVCAWCKKPMGIKPGDSDLPISHGICPECANKLRSETNTSQHINRKENDK
ncbi:hypothetical protein [Desulfobacterium sp. N47]|uniref:Uncharacterized protein n=1 Tax=uncultured Desulfobacterium sp. TaxID=201089 RepID=E1Y9A2_9BACT|nr:unknown protein [uncultured Desulfobacterium sp.]